MWHHSVSLRGSVNSKKLTKYREETDRPGSFVRGYLHSMHSIASMLSNIILIFSLRQVHLTNLIIFSIDLFDVEHEFRQYQSINTYYF